MAISIYGPSDDVSRAGDTMTGPLKLQNTSIQFTPSGDPTSDVNLYRDAANVLKTDDSFVPALIPPTATLPVGPSTANAGALNIPSSFAGGSDDGTGYDSTGRINLYSYQRAYVRSYGEPIRIHLMKYDAKGMIAWYGPKNGFDPVTRDPIAGSVTPVTWIGSHFEANNRASYHMHWEVEVPDSTGALQGRLEILFGDQTTGTIGLDKTQILTNLADFVVRCSNGQQFILSSSAGNELPITFSRNVGASMRRWKIRVTSEAESGSDAGSNFQLVRYSDADALIDSPIIVSRATGLVSFGGTSGTAGGVAITRASGVGLTITPTATGGQAALVIGTDATARSWQGQVSGDTTTRSVVYVDGKIEWGSGSATRDVNLYRSSANVLKTDYSFTVTKNLRINTTSVGGGDGIIAIANATTVPTSNPTAAVLLYSEGGRLKVRQPDGTVQFVALTAS